MAPTMISQFVLQAAADAQLAAYRARPVGKPKAIVQIAHGMAEHFPRYRRLTDALTRADYAVYGADHRGHGASAGLHGLGSFGPRGFQSVVDDMAALSRLAKAENPGVPLILLGHSMGSFAAQLYLLEHHGELAALVLSGTAAMDRMLEAIAASGQAPGPGVMNGAFEPARTDWDWLSRDEAQVDAYVADPLCGFALEDDAMASMFELGARARHDPRLSSVRRDLPIYVISGEMDPVTGPGQANARALIDSYQAAGLSRIDHRIYPGGRHEMFNETNRAEVEADLVAWLDSALADLGSSA
jgi:alpha-beta hydrolase superfamily lysophospholipase